MELFQSNLSISQHFNGPISGGKNALNSCSQQLLNHVVVVEVATVVVVWKKNSVRAWNDLAMNLQRALPPSYVDATAVDEYTMRIGNHQSTDLSPNSVQTQRHQSGQNGPYKPYELHTVKLSVQNQNHNQETEQTLREL